MKRILKASLTAAILASLVLMSALAALASPNLKSHTVNASESTDYSQALILASQEKTNLDDGIYTIEAVLSGGSGRASLNSARIAVLDGAAMAVIEWSSPNYDYMIVNGAKYLPINDTGNSKFLIPVCAFDKEFAVIADTLAMSKPHEVEYTITFQTDTAKKLENGRGLSIQTAALIMTAIIAVIIAAISVTLFIKRSKK